MINTSQPPHPDYSTPVDRTATGYASPTPPALTFQTDYHYALEAFKNNLHALANSTITEDILKKLNEISQGILNTEQGISLDLSLPEDTQTYLARLNQQIQAEGRFHFNRLSEVASIIKKNLKELASERKKAPPLSLELTHLFKLSQIRSLSNEQITIILELINKEDIHGLRDRVSSFLTESEIKEIDQHLTITDYPNQEGKLRKYRNLNALLGSVIKQKPQQPEGFLTYWKQAPAFFKDKLMDLTDPHSKRHHQGIILDCSTHLQKKIFYLHDESEIHISDTYQVTCVKKHSDKLWTAIQKGWLDNHVFEIRNITNRTIAGEIKAGTYQHTKLISSSSSFEIELRGIGNSERYKISGVYQKGENHNPFLTLSQWSNEKQAFIELCKGSEWHSTYRALKREEEGFSNFNQANMDKHITLKWDENRIKLFHLEQIQKQLQEVRQEFMRQRNSKLLNTLLHNCLSNQLKKIDFDVLNDKNPDLAKKLQQISQRYYTDLQMSYLPEDLLKKIIIEVNALILFDSEASPTILRMMEFLKESYHHVKKIKGKKTLFFMGQTGSGKSTAVSYFLNADLEFFNHPVGGDKIVKFKNEQQQDTFPSIGQSLSESKILYTQGYALPQTSEIELDITLADCPGFCDTKGIDDELCTYISMDLAIKEARSIQALIVVIPIEAFVADQGKSLIDLVSTIQDRFPHAFNLEKPDDNSSLYLLLTKDCQAKDETVASVRDGSRIREYLEETERKLQELQDHQHKTNNPLEVPIAQLKCRIWTALTHMYTNKQINILDILDPNEKDLLLKKYIRSPSMDKKNYEPALQKTSLQRKFGDYIEMSTHTWIHQILKKYLYTLPSLIKESQLRINELNKKKNGDNIEEQIQLIQQEKEQAETNLNDLQIAKRNLAILIYTQHDHAKSLKEFAQLALDSQAQSKEPPRNRYSDKPSFIENCQEFIRIYDQQIEKLKEECQKDLALPFF